MGLEDTIRRPSDAIPSSSRGDSAGRTDPGKVRSANEDALIDRPDIGLWAVADGVGGAMAGARASGLVVDALAGVRSPESAQAFLDEVRERLRMVNEQLIVEARAISADATMASTVVILLFFEGFFACAWAGDSRLYLMRDGVLQQVTRDHSEVQELLQAGSISAEQARNHPRGNVITRAVGAQEELALEVVQDRICPGDLFLLCSDGLTKMLADAEIASALDGRPPAVLVDELIEATLERGAIDNVTILAVRAETGFAAA
jgi:serine/threonine protein phosphatase PrpC